MKIPKKKGYFLKFKRGECKKKIGGAFLQSAQDFQGE